MSSVAFASLVLLSTVGASSMNLNQKLIARLSSHAQVQSAKISIEETINRPVYTTGYVINSVYSDMECSGSARMQMVYALGQCENDFNNGNFQSTRAESYQIGPISNQILIRVSTYEGFDCDSGNSVPTTFTFSSDCMGGEVFAYSETVPSFSNGVILKNYGDVKSCLARKWVGEVDNWYALAFYPSGCQEIGGGYVYQSTVSCSRTGKHEPYSIIVQDGLSYLGNETSCDAASLMETMASTHVNCESDSHGDHFATWECADGTASTWLDAPVTAPTGTLFTPPTNAINSGFISMDVYQSESDCSGPFFRRVLTVDECITVTAPQGHGSIKITDLSFTTTEGSGVVNFYSDSHCMDRAPYIFSTELTDPFPCNQTNSMSQCEIYFGVSCLAPGELVNTTYYTQLGWSSTYPELASDDSVRYRYFSDEESCLANSDSNNGYSVQYPKDECLGFDGDLSPLSTRFMITRGNAFKYIQKLYHNSTSVEGCKDEDYLYDYGTPFYNCAKTQYGYLTSTATFVNPDNGGVTIPKDAIYSLLLLLLLAFPIGFGLSLVCARQEAGSEGNDEKQPDVV